MGAGRFEDPFALVILPVAVGVIGVLAGWLGRRFWRHVTAGELPVTLSMQHEGHCGRCGRTLTHPDSINTGYGPECAARIAAEREAV
jgi:hypothetical protein